MKSRFLLVDDEPELLELMTIMIEEEIPGASIVQCLNGYSAIEILREDSHFVAILCDYNMHNGTGGDVYKYCRENGIDAPFILISGGFIKDYPEFVNFELDSSRNLFLAKPFSEELLLNYLKSLVGESGEEAESSTRDLHFIEISVDILIKHFDICPECYLKLNDSKMVTVVHSDGHQLDQLQIFQHKQSGNLFIRKEDFNRFFFQVLEKLCVFEDNNLRIFEEKQLKLNQSSSRDLGIPESTKVLIDHSIDEVLQEIQRGEGAYLLEKWDFSNAGEFRAHVVLIFYLGYMIHKHSLWSNSRMIRTHLLASLIHDFFLEQELFKKELNFSNESNHGKLDQHIRLALDACLKIWKEDSVLESIVRQHHELPEGKGIPRGLGAKDITLPSAVFNLAHYLAMGMIRAKVFDRKQIYYLLEQSRDFDSGAYSQVYKVAMEIWRN